jgi:hypothetical protein
MRRYILGFAGILSLAAALSAAQATLPNSFGKWSGSAKSLENPPAVPGIDQAASLRAEQHSAALKEFGLIGAETAIYTRGTDTLQIALYKLKDPSGAYGEYLYLRTPDMPRAELAELSCASRDHALLLIGNLVVDIRGRELARFLPDLKTLADSVSPRAEKGLLPTLQDRLPQDGLIERTGHYVLGPATLAQFFPYAEGDWLGFSEGAEAESARYRVNGHEVTLLIADFPTPQAAQRKLAELQAKFNVNDSGNGGLAPVYAKRSISLLAIVGGVESQAEAGPLLNQVHSTAEVTWNEPTFIFKEPSLTTMIADAIVGTMVICGFALIAGFAFGGFRLLIKRLLPDKVFDRSSSMQVLQLGLYSKPIKAEDFYGLGRTPRE